MQKALNIFKLENDDNNKHSITPSTVMSPKNDVNGPFPFYPLLTFKVCKLHSKLLAEKPFSIALLERDSILQESQNVE